MFDRAWWTSKPSFHDRALIGFVAGVIFALSLLLLAPGRVTLLHLLFMPVMTGGYVVLLSADAPGLRMAKTRRDAILLVAIPLLIAFVLFLFLK